MSYTVSKYPHGTFSWTDVMSTDIAASKKFMTKLMGWTAKDMPTDKGPDYTMFLLDGKSVAGGSPFPPDMKGVPSYWSNYVSVDDIDSMISKVEKLGGKVNMPVMQVMKAGKMAAIQDPTGAMLMLWEAKEHAGAEIVNKAGAMGWNELRTKDVDKAKDFYGSLFGWKFEFDEKNKYTTIKNNGRFNGGVMEIDASWGDTPPHWAVYFTVKNIEKTVAKVKELGGNIAGEIIDAPDVGRFAMISDPANAHFTAIQMSAEPEHWEE